MGIIGIIAVLLLPRVFDSIEEKQYDTARKVILKNIGDAVKLVALNSDIRSAENSEDFVENYLSKEIKMLKTCSNENLRECGIETGTNKIFTVNEQRATMPITINDLAPNMSKGTYIDPSEKSYGFVMPNGYSFNLFYNKSCISDNKSSAMFFQDRMCLNVIYDINGLSSPNQMGKDIGFVTVLYPNSIEMHTVAPNVYKVNSSDANFYTAPSICAKLGAEYKVPEKDELMAMYFNFNLLNLNSDYLSSTSIDNETSWVMGSNSGWITPYLKTRGARLRCVK